MKVLKFGGTSVGNADNIRKVKSIVDSQTGDIIVVVSALGGITDKILTAAKAAATGTGNYHEMLAEIKSKHEETINSLFNGTGSIKYIVE